MKRILLLYYSAIILSAMILGSFYPFATSTSIILSILFLPLVISLWVAIYRVQKRKLTELGQFRMIFSSKKMLALLVYCILLSVIIFIGAFANIKNSKEALTDILFIPVIVQLLLWFVPLLKKSKNSK